MKQMLAASLLGAVAVVVATPAMAALPFTATAQTAVTVPPPSGVLALQAQAVAEVPTDTVHMTLAAEQDGSDPAAISSALSTRAQQVIQQAKATAGVQAESGGFTIHPMTDKNGKISTWRGRAEVILHSRDFAAVSKLAGDLGAKMQMQGMNFTLSREVRQAAENKLAAEAVENFRQKALATAKLFGYSGYTLREVNINEASVTPPIPRMYAAKAMSMEAAPPIPVEGGKTTVTVLVNGSVQMVRQ